MSTFHFEWLTTPRAPSPSAATKAMRDSELARRAQLLAHLGYSRAEVERRLKARLEWEHEGLGKPQAVRRVAAVTGEVFGKITPAAAVHPAKKKPKR